MSNKKLFYLFSAIAIAIVIPLTIHSVNQQQNTNSNASGPEQTVQVQANDQGVITTIVNSGLDPANVTPTPNPQNGKQRIYSIGVATHYGNWCWNQGFNYKVNGLLFHTSSGASRYNNLCADGYTFGSSANCNTISLVPPSGYHVVGVGYKKASSGLGNFTYVNDKSVRLCDRDYIVTFSIELDGSTAPAQ